ncbi:cuticle protein 7-like isoform X2 [Cherax quadricarinatus]|uniref:cuticle protein 7-like isoform X2 n=1 Tax=Cherax quadricarinatus TaxID=27406 RepID=UPI002378E22A|nr:cuticle protein 7-like isoform X2 [Cherax quadricarinatus]
MAATKVVVVVVMIGVLALCMGVPQYPPPPPPPRYGHSPSYKEPAHPYNYAYEVKDGYKGVQFSAGESSDGNNVKGSYQVALPDGRLQNVDYNADHYTGYKAQVTYQGEAQHPPQPHYPAPASYHPQPPSYHPQPYSG